MERWIGKTAVVTGASAGIGAAISVDLANAGLNVVALARRKEKLEELKSKISKGSKGSLHAVKCDVTVEQDIKDVFAWVEKELGGVDILVNNAGIVRSTELVDKNNSQPIREIIDTNVLGVVFCTREAFQSMKAREVNGHIININSIAGHSVPYSVGSMGSFNIYPASKYAVTALTECLRQELQSHQTKIKVTSVSPGAVRTEIFLPEHVKAMKDMPFLESEDISQAVLYAIGTPPHVQVHEIIVKPIGEKF